jgi:UDPglucose 6-dehydrogenase
MKLSIIGTGYVGLVTGACLADVGNDVLCIDTDADKVKRLRAGEVPIFEPGLDAIVQRNVEAGRLRFGTNPAEGAAFATLQFIAVGTPPGEDGSADLRHVLAAACAIGRHMTGDRVVVDKSTVPVGTARRVKQEIARELQARGASHKVSVVSNPEFLKEGDAIADFTRPDRIIIGSDDEQATRLLRQLYGPFSRNHDRILVMDTESAELSKYAANAMLATRISFMNELALLAEALGADIDAVRRGIGADERIGHHFIYAGCGYGGSCFPKDVRALLKTGAENGHRLQLLQAVEAVNDRQKLLLGERIVAAFGEDLRGLLFAVWGLAFKPNTDDVREAPSLLLIRDLLQRGATVRVYDPAATASARRALGEHDRLHYVPRAMEALDGADALAIVTEWKEFRSPDFERMRELMRQPVVFDGRNLYDPAFVQQAGLQYRAIGRKE